MKSIFTNFDQKILERWTQDLNLQSVSAQLFSRQPPHHPDIQLIVQGRGLEPPRPLGLWILSPVRLHSVTPAYAGRLALCYHEPCFPAPLVSLSIGTCVLLCLHH